MTGLCQCPSVLTGTFLLHQAERRCPQGVCCEMLDFKSLQQVDSCLFNFSRQFHWNAVYKSNPRLATEMDQAEEGLYDFN